MRKKSVAVVGAGIAGITTAFMLQQRGHQVTIFDRNAEPAQECSKANGGQISVSNSEVWTTWPNVLKGLTWMLSPEAPLALRLDHWSWPKARWIAGFLGATVANKYESNTRETIALAIESAEIIKEIAELEDIQFDQRYDGILHVYRDDDSLAAAARVCERFEDTGWGRTLLGAREARALAGPITMYDMQGATYTPNDFTGDVNKFTLSLFEVVKRRGGVYVQQEIDREQLEEMQYEWDDVVVCAGAYTSLLFPRLEIYPVKGYSVTFNVGEELLPKVSLLDERAKVVTSSFNGRFRVAGTAELGGWDQKVYDHRTYPLVRWTYDNTRIKTSVYDEWACLRPMTPNMMPVVQYHDRMIVNSGAGHLGWTMCMALAKRAADLVL